MEFLKTIFILLEVLLFFNLMIVVHELGHMLAARWRGLVVERFGIWFGKPLWQKQINGVWYSLGSLPFGGFVALPQLAPMEAIEGSSAHDRAQLPPITPLDKIIVAAAGPVFSLGLAFVFAIAVWFLGRPVSESEATTTIGYVMPGSPAERAGLQAGDRLVSVDGQPVQRWAGLSADSVTWRIVRSEGETLAVTFERDGETQTVTARPTIPERRFWQRRATRQLQMLPAETPMVARVETDSPAAAAGLQPSDLITHVNDQRLFNPYGLSTFARQHPDAALTLTVQRGTETLQLPFAPRGATVGDVVPRSPASNAGLRPGDRIVAVDGQPARLAEDIGRKVQDAAGRTLSLRVERGDSTLDVPITPAIPRGETIPRIGIRWGSESGIVFDEYGKLEVVHPGPLEQIQLSLMAIVNTFDALLSSKSDIKLQHMAGPVQIVRVYYILFENPDGWRQAIWFSVILNVNLALLNLLPLPVLDGGHIVLALVEWIRRRPLPARAIATMQYAFALLLISFMLYVTFFDAQDWMGSASGPTMEFDPAPAPPPSSPSAPAP